MTLRSLVVVVGAFFVVACSAPPIEPPHLLYDTDAQSLDNPLPDLRLMQNGSPVMRPEWYRPFVTEKARTPKSVAVLNLWGEGARSATGVGNIAPTLLRTSVPVDPETLAGKVVRLRRGAGGSYEVLERDVTVEHSFDALPSSFQTAPEGYPDFLLVRPSIPLSENEEGLLVVLRGPMTREGTALGRGFDFGNEKESVQRAKDAAAALELPESDVLLALPLKAGVTRAPMRALQQWVKDSLQPSSNIPAKGVVDNLLQGTWTSADTDWSRVYTWLHKEPFANPASLVGKVIVGTFKSKDLRDENGLWNQAYVQNPNLAPDKDIPFTLTLPVGPKPEGGYRIVLGAHGLNSRNSLLTTSTEGFCASVAQTLAKSGLGCLGTDAVNHGTRGAMVDFFDVANLGRTRDNIRQTTFDLMQLAKVASSLDVDGDGQADVSPELGFFGNSLGSILGGALLTYSPEISYGVLNVAAAELGNILTSPNISTSLGFMLIVESGLTLSTPEYYSMFPLFRTLGQIITDPADPINLTEYIGADRGVLLQEGLNDRTLPNFTTDHLAKAMGLAEVDAVPANGEKIQVIYRVDPTRYGKAPGHNGHNVFWEFSQTRDQAMRFLEHRGTQLTAE